MMNFKINYIESIPNTTDLINKTVIYDIINTNDIIQIQISQINPERMFSVNQMINKKDLENLFIEPTEVIRELFYDLIKKLNKQTYIPKEVVKALYLHFLTDMNYFLKH